MEQKPILIQGAMEDEIALIKEKMEEVEEIKLYDYIFYKGKIDEYPIILSKTQVGLMNVTAATVVGIINFSPCIIINQGVAGGITKNVHKGDFVIGQSCININSFQTPYKEEGKGSNSLEWELKTFKEGIDELVVLKANTELIKLAEEEAKKQKFSYVVGTMGSGDVWNAEKDRLLWLSKKYDILCEDMETIGTYQMGLKFNIPTIGIRILSDNLLLGEEYDKSVGKIGQEYVYNLVKRTIGTDLFVPISEHRGRT